jgi:hypothetical protein
MTRLVIYISRKGRGISTYAQDAVSSKLLYRNKQLYKLIKMIARFEGESRKQAIVNHFSLDIDEEKAFFKYIADMGYEIGASDDIIESLHEMWNNNSNAN